MVVFFCLALWLLPPGAGLRGENPGKTESPGGSQRPGVFGIYLGQSRQAALQNMKSRFPEGRSQRIESFRFWTGEFYEFFELYREALSNCVIGFQNEKVFLIHLSFNVGKDEIRKRLEKKFGPAELYQARVLSWERAGNTRVLLDGTDTESELQFQEIRDAR
tara:strand:+ start:43661 stop:44146 length:486 start_codon:yes stop_codon:yes gene_type:complete